MAISSSLKMQDCDFPTLDRLGVQPPRDIDAAAIATQWFASFAKNLEQANAQGIRDLLLPNAFWRDFLSLTWDFRTFYSDSILTFLEDRLAGVKISKVTLDAGSIRLDNPQPDMAWIMASFTFETAIGLCSGIIRIVPTASGEWKAYTVFTNLEDLRDHLEKIGARREQDTGFETWPEKRRKEVECEGESEQPAVVIIGAGQTGLIIAARLKYLGIKSLIIEKQAHVGHGWRSRYESLRLHDTVWYDQMPYMPFPPTWPVYAPAPKIAEWLEHYASTLELNVWTSTTLLNNKQDPNTLKWAVELQRGDGSKRTFVVNHIIGCIGPAGGKGVIPNIPGENNYGGKTLHSTVYATARDYIGKRVAVVGACNSAYDISSDLYHHGADVTMIQRSSTCITSVKGLQVFLGGSYNENIDPNVSDRVLASFPRWAGKELTQRMIKAIAHIDKDILDGLKKVGFRTSLGDEDCGPLFTVFNRGGGFYLDIGGCQLVADGKVKLKSDSHISRFTKTGLEFENGTTLDADVVIYATGFGDTCEAYREILQGLDNLNPLWGLDAEGELNSVCRDTGVPGFWLMQGNLAMGRFHSKHIALQIKALEEGLWDGKRYNWKA